MTGKDLIIYILKHDLEDEIVFKDGYFSGFLTIQEVAAKFDVGVETVRLWYSLGMLEGIVIGNRLYFSRDVTDPRAV